MVAESNFEGFDAVIATKKQQGDFATGELMYLEHRECGNKPLHGDDGPYCPVCDYDD